MKPLCIDLYCGLGGWSEGALAEGYEVVGFDIERHVYSVPEMPEGDGSKQTKSVEKRGWTQGCAVSLGLEGANAKPRTRLMRYSAQLVLQDVTTLHGSQVKDAALIVASPPCQAYSYMAMPWKRAKVIAAEIRADETGAKLAALNLLFDACFRLQREASEAAGHYIPLVVENVKGAQPWVGRAAWHYGSFYLWGDVPALMPATFCRKVVTKYAHVGSWKSENGDDWRSARNAGLESEGVKQHGSGAAWFDKALDERRKEASGLKAGKDWLGGYGGNFGWDCSPMRRNNSHSTARKAASAQIAKIPFELARYIAHVYKP